MGSIIEPLTGRAWRPPEIAARVAVRAAEYGRAGLEPDARVLVCYGNELEFFVDLLAIWHLGACAIPVDPRLTPFAIANIARAARPRFAVADDASLMELRATLADCSVDWLPKPAMADAVPTHVPSSRQRADADALVLFTSGTTGAPKGVLHTHRSLAARWHSLEAALGLAKFRRTLCLLPTHFGHGLICNCLFPWLRGQDLHVLPPFRGDLLARLGEILDAQRITFLSSVPTVWRLATKTARPPSAGSLEGVFCGSAPLSASLWRAVRQWAGTRSVVNAYGITETGSWLAGTTVPFAEPEDGLIGKAWGGELRILPTSATSIDPRTAPPCAPGESGHVWVRTPALMKGYLDRDDLTAQVVRDGWFSTGDIGTLDARGYLYLHGREREEINKGGTKIHPADIDAVIERFPGTLDVCAFAVDDALFGEDIGVALVLAGDRDATLLQAQHWAAQYLAVHQLPRKWYVVDALPRTAQGKVNRAQVARLCAGRPAAAGVVARPAPHA